MSSKYKIGDRFLIPEITRLITEANDIFIQKQTIKNGIAVIIESHVDDKDGCEYYYLKINNDFGLFYIGENSLSKYDMIITQNKNTKATNCFEEKVESVSEELTKEVVLKIISDKIPNDKLRLYMTSPDPQGCIDIKIFTEKHKEDFYEQYFGL